MQNWISETTLQGNNVILRPLEKNDKEALLDAVSDGQLWRLWFTAVPSESTLETYIEQALLEQRKKQSLVFVVICKKTNEILGCTRFCHIDSVNQRLEIGYTWYRKSVQRTAVNTETKLLLLTHAFESLKAIAVEFRTHWMNHQSRNAILRLGAKQDGILRNHQRMADGSFRDTVIFSIIQSEWLSVRRNLSEKLAAK